MDIHRYLQHVDKKLVFTASLIGNWWRISSVTSFGKLVILSRSRAILHLPELFSAMSRLTSKKLGSNFTITMIYRCSVAKRVGGNRMSVGVTDFVLILPAKEVLRNLECFHTRTKKIYHTHTENGKVSRTINLASCLEII